MVSSRQVSQALDDEHRANLELLGRAERVYARPDDPEARPLAGQLVRHLEHEIGRHFGFEEEQLFPRMADAGDGDLAEMLREEHDTIRAVADELLPLARAAAAGRCRPRPRPRCAAWCWKSSSARSAHPEGNDGACCRCSTICSTTRPTANWPLPTLCD
jgi:iron-sulfur cluster repair protein YtfE (RIC family)